MQTIYFSRWQTSKDGVTVVKSRCNEGATGLAVMLSFRYDLIEAILPGKEIMS